MPSRCKVSPHIELALSYQLRSLAIRSTILRMPDDVLQIEDLPASGSGHRILRLNGPLVLKNIFQFQSLVRADNSRALILDFTNVPYADSAGIGALVGAYVNHQKEGRRLALVGISDRVHNALKVTRVEQFFTFFDSVDDAEQASAA
jgi:anti-sigma B factor antagonist